MEYATGLPLDMPLICHWNATGMPLYTGVSHCPSLAALTGRPFNFHRRPRRHAEVHKPSYETVFEQRSATELQVAGHRAVPETLAIQARY